MSIGNALYVFYHLKLHNPVGLTRLVRAIRKEGVNIMALLRFAADSYGEKNVLVDENETISYRQLFMQTQKLSVLLKNIYRLQSGQKAAFLCKNHASLVKSVFAASRLGLDLHLLNTEMSREQLHQIIKYHRFDFLVYDFEFSDTVEQSDFSGKSILSYHEHLPAINSLRLSNINADLHIKRNSQSKISLLTGGTTGNYKKAVHKPSVFNYLNPFAALLKRLELFRHHTVYIATPIYHGYGIAVLFLFFALGKKVIIRRRFEAGIACRLIREYQVEVITVVPLMLHKMLKTGAGEMKSLVCIASGGAELNPQLIERTFRELGDILYNLYGTSEAGLNMIATPQDLQYSPTTIGKRIQGVRLKILDTQRKEVGVDRIGQMYIKNRWSMWNRQGIWMETGDLGYRDRKGYFFLCGRADDMIVSAGENVYPIEVEQILKGHPQIEDAAVTGIPDTEFGQRLKAFVLPAKNSGITQAELFAWLRTKAARFQIPKEILFVDEIPYTSLGKPDKKQFEK